jgi:hypothetical protein
VAISEDGSVTSTHFQDIDPDMPELEVVMRELVAYVDGEGWDQYHRLFALADTRWIQAYNPHLSGQLDISRSFVPIEQEELPYGPLDQVLEQIGWPPEVAGCVLITELHVLPPSAEQEIPYTYDEREIEHWVRTHPEVLRVRAAIGVTRVGEHRTLEQKEGDPADLAHLVPDGEWADHLVAPLYATLLAAAD